jgi:hypothetical protein
LDAGSGLDGWRSADATEPMRPDIGDPVATGQYDADEVGWVGAAIGPADEDLDLLAESNRRPGKLTITLAAGILVAAAFVGGVLVQKHYGTAATPAASSRFNRQLAGFGGGAGGGGGGGGFGGYGNLGAGGATGGGAAAAADTPAVVGQVVKVSGTTVTVKNFAGKTFTVKVPAGTTISLSSSLSLTGLKAGTSVSVVGKTAADGSITASAVTARK